MTLPNFLIIGAAKSGTSALYYYLNQHPEIFMSPIKEPHFFGYEDAHPNAQGPDDFVNTAVTNIDDYQALFADVKDEIAIGEASPTYIHIPRAVERIKHHVPNAKLIAILRQPADRAFSAYMHVRRDHREPISDFAEALKMEEKRIEMNWGPIWHYTKVGFYHHHLTTYYQNFSPEQIRVYIYDQFKEDPAAVLQDIFRFLGVDDTFMPEIGLKVNVSGEQKSKQVDLIIRNLFNRPNPIRYIARRTLPHDLRWRFTTNVRNKNLVQTKIPPKVRADLTDLFRDDILKLQDLISQDLSHWLR